MQEKDKQDLTLSQKEPDWVPGPEYYDPPQSKDRLSAMDKQYAASPKDIDRRIFILGSGNIGKLIAHSLRALPDPPPVTLLLARAWRIKSWHASDKTITIARDGFEIKQGGIDVEYTPIMKRSHGQIVMQADEPGIPAEYKSDEPISNLIVTTKSHEVVSSILQIKHRITPQTTLCLLQNGLGAIDELNEQLFPDPAQRPSYIVGILTHGVNVPAQVARERPFFAIHAGLGTMSLTILQPEGAAVSKSPSEIARTAIEDGTERPGYWTAGARYVLRQLTRSPVLVAVGFAPTDLFLLRLEKLAVNCIINSLTVLLDARNGSITNNFAIKRTIRLMLAEISLVIRSLPELRGLANVETRFSAQRLESLVNDVATTTANNISSTLADVRAGRRTEIQYMNGYIVKRGEELGIKCVVNYAMMQLVIGKSNMAQQEEQTYIPFD